MGTCSQSHGVRVRWRARRRALLAAVSVVGLLGAVPDLAGAQPPDPTYRVTLNDCVTGNNQFWSQSDQKFRWCVNQNASLDRRGRAPRSAGRLRLAPVPTSYERPTDQTFRSNTDRSEARRGGTAVHVHPAGTPAGPCLPLRARSRRRARSGPVRVLHRGRPVLRVPRHHARPVRPHGDAVARSRASQRAPAHRRVSGSLPGPRHGPDRRRHRPQERSGHGRGNGCERRRLVGPRGRNRRTRRLHAHGGPALAPAHEGDVRREDPGSRAAARRARRQVRSRSATGGSSFRSSCSAGRRSRPTCNGR